MIKVNDILYIIDKVVNTKLSVSDKAEILVIGGSDIE